MNPSFNFARFKIKIGKMGNRTHCVWGSSFKSSLAFIAVVLNTLLGGYQAIAQCASNATYNGVGIAELEVWTSAGKVNLSGANVIASQVIL